MGIQAVRHQNDLIAVCIIFFSSLARLRLFSLRYRRCRRTIYAYYESKEDILHHLIEKGLILLKGSLENALKSGTDFFGQYKAVCTSMLRYQRECPHSLENINHGRTGDLDITDLSDRVKNILRLGTEINNLLAGFIEKGKENGIVRRDVIPMMAVNVLWPSITSLLQLVRTKGEFISKQLFLMEGLRDA